LHGGGRAALAADGHFSVLALSQDRVRLFRGAHDGLVEVAGPGSPTSRAEALWFEDEERWVNVHGGSRPTVGARSAPSGGAARATLSRY
jgi:hypothetical protein